MAISAYDRIRKVDGLEDPWQSHLAMPQVVIANALATDAAHNTSPDLIPNLAFPTRVPEHRT